MGRKGFATKHKSIYTYGHFTELVQSQKTNIYTNCIISKVHIIVQLILILFFQKDFSLTKCITTEVIIIEQ